jgi:hypothetical protein
MVRIENTQRVKHQLSPTKAAILFLHRGRLGRAELQRAPSFDGRRHKSGGVRAGNKSALEARKVIVGAQAPTFRGALPASFDVGCARTTATSTGRRLTVVDKPIKLTSWLNK